MKRLDSQAKREALKNPHLPSDGFANPMGQYVGTAHSVEQGMPQAKNTQNPLGYARKRTKGM